jgi:hypothetical protein
MRWWMALFGSLVAYAVLAQTAEKTDRSADEAVLRDQRLPTKGPALLQILRDRTPSADTIGQFKMHVARLNVAAYADRVNATSELKKMGPIVRPLLENLLLEIKADAETVGRLRQALEQFPAEQDIAAVESLRAAARLIARDRPQGSLPALLEFVPYATDESVRQEVQRAINAVALVEKKPAPLLVAALKDANPARRAAAGEAMLRVVGLAAKDKIAPLLTDSHPLVRYQIGMALVEKHDQRGVHLLIQTLADSPSDRAQNALELLYRAAGEGAPDVYYRGKHNAAEVSAAWRKWHEKHQTGLDLAKQFARTELGFTIIATTIGGKANAKNKICEIGPGPDHAVRWEFDGPRNPLDVQVLGPNRLLIAEYTERRVTERDFKGTVLKQFPAALPIGCQRLPNNQTFIVTRQQLRIVDHDGKDVFTWFPQNLSITAAQRLRNGQIAVTTSGGLCQLLDPQGRELKSFQMGGSIYTLGGNIEVLPNGRILAPLYNLSSVVEFDWAGSKLWQANVNRPTSVSRLTNGHSLVTCMLDNRVIEIDQNGKEVWSFQTEGRPTRARRR